MKGIILAGGNGIRLRPITQYLNKHLFPVYNKPMILFPIETMKSVGIDDVVVVTDRYRGDKIVEFLGSGQDYGVSLTYRFQERADGIGDAIRLCESYVKNEKVLVMLGDNIVFDNLNDQVKQFDSGCTVFLKKVDDPERFGVAKFDAKKRIVSLVEKPDKPPSNYAVTGIYLFDRSVFEKIRFCHPSRRGELEVVCILMQYLAENKLNYRILKDVWIDAGTFESLYKASSFVRNIENKK